ncbi:MAG: hypothetical protein LBR74_10090 [Eubacterium sp.]|jgi:Holliday junction resolvase|nr:hypothetical protein [Eubacterium sp.]
MDIGDAMTNKKLGNDFETAFCETLFENGYWVHNLAQNQAGQPADVLAVKNGRPFLIDCKVCTGRGFALSRLEENQDLSMGLWKWCANGEGWFAFLIGTDIYMMQYTALKACKKHLSVLSNKDIKTWGFPLNDWLVWAQK